MNVRSKTYGRVSVMVTHAGLPALRLLASHCPIQRIEVRTPQGESHMTPLSDIDLGHESVTEENPRDINVDRAQLAKLGASNHQLAPAAAPIR